MTQARIKVKERVYRERNTRGKVEESVAGEGALTANRRDSGKYTASQDHAIGTNGIGQSHERNWQQSKPRTCSVDVHGMVCN